MNAQELIAAIHEMKKTNPAEYAVFQKDYAEEMTEGVEFWSANCGYITLWKLQEGVEVSGCELEGEERFGDEWGCLKGISTRTITKKMVERENFMKDDDESDDEDDAEVGCSSCPKCENTYTQKQIDDGEVVPCNRCYKCFVGECGEDNCECVFDDEKEEAPVEAPVKDEKKENKKEMKAYMKARMNYLMGKAKDGWDQYGLTEDGMGEECDFTLKKGWDAEEFDNLLCSLCEKRQVELNENQHQYQVSMIARKKTDNKWEVEASWCPVQIDNPFDYFYDEDEEMIDSEDDEDDE